MELILRRVNSGKYQRTGGQTGLSISVSSLRCPHVEPGCIEFMLWSQKPRWWWSTGRDCAEHYT